VTPFPNLLGTITLAILAGQNRYAHVTARRADAVNPRGLGMAECETRGQSHLFRLRQRPGVKQLVRLLESHVGWRTALHGYKGAEGPLQLNGWSAPRRVIVLRRLRERATDRPARD
jgi:hypothetical protein